MSTVRPALALSVALAVGSMLNACGKEEAPKPPAKPAASAPTAPASAPPAASAPAPQATTPVAPAQPATPAPSVSDPDKVLAKKVKSALDTTQGVPGQQIDVTAKGGAVTLWGTVADPVEQAKAVEAAKAVPGVKAVENKLAIVKGS
ncbi:MAG TPA: BON domain-containing protein [Burkholderiales bacterium]|nr:BON domain-containing protein [Burkholderiales bacterium]